MRLRSPPWSHLPATARPRCSASWAERDRRPFAWVIVDGATTPAPASREGARALGGGAPERCRRPLVLVIDDLQLLDHPAALEPWPSSSVTCHRRSRSPSHRGTGSPCRSPAFGSSGCTELGPRDLAMTRARPPSCSGLACLEVDRDGVETLLHRTEGWPAGLSLAASCARRASAYGNRNGSRRRSSRGRLPPRRGARRPLSGAARVRAADSVLAL